MGLGGIGSGTLSQHVRTLRRGALIVVATVVIVTGLAIATSSAQTALYESQAEVFLSGARNIPSNLADIQQYAIDPERAANTQASLARTPAVSRQALQLAHVRDMTPDELIGNTQIENPEGADILRFTVTDENPKRAKVLATAYAQAYTNYRRHLDTGSIVEARRQLEGRLAKLEQSGQIKTPVYRNMAQNAQRLRTAEALEGGNAALINEGRNATQTQPKTSRNAVLGALLGLVLGVALAYLRNALNTRVQDSEEIQEKLELPLLARIPELPPELVDEKVAMIVDPYAPETEAFRILATNLGFVNLDRGAKSIMVTSSHRGEGKSTAVANMAVALARAGSRVTLVDLDLKRPNVHRLFGLPHNRPGITSLALAGTTADEAAAQIPLRDPSVDSAGAAAQAPEGSLEVFTTGPIPPDTADFVASATLSRLLEELGERCDVLLVDAPPILQISDAVTLTGKIDALVVVARMGIIRRPTLDELRRVLEAMPTTKLGFIVTGITRTAGYYGYGYGYYGYGARPVPNGSRASSVPERVP